MQDDDHVARYCSPRTVEDGVPTAFAFLLRSTEEYLSVNWLECFEMPDLAGSVDCVREVFQNKGYGLSKKGCFVVLNIGNTKFLILNTIGEIPRFVHLPGKYDMSHAGIFFRVEKSLEVAGNLAMQVRLDPQSTYPGVINCA